MRCPYQTKVTHKPEHIEGYVKHFSEDTTTFCECLKVNVRFITRQNINQQER